MKTHELSDLSWVATPGSLDALPPSLVKGKGLRASRLGHDDVRAACTRDDGTLYLAAANGWIYVFGFQAGLGALASELSKARGLALSFENNTKRDVRLCSVYRDGAVARQLSDIGGRFSEEGSPLPGEPQLAGSIQNEAVEQLSRAWGADVALLDWNTAALRAAPRRPRLLWVAVFLVVLAILATLAVRAVPTAAERCRQGCERSWQRTYAYTPECRGVAIEECESYRSAIRECAVICR